MANFIDFIIDAQENENLLKKFVECKKPEDLKKFFGNKYRVSKADCKKLINAKKKIGLTDWPDIPPAY